MSAPVLVNRVHQGRQAARARSNRRDALGRAAQHPDHGRVRAGLSSANNVRDLDWPATPRGTIEPQRLFCALANLHVRHVPPRVRSQDRPQRPALALLALRLPGSTAATTVARRKCAPSATPKRSSEPCASERETVTSSRESEAENRNVEKYAPVPKSAYRYCNKTRSQEQASGSSLHTNPV